MVRRNRRRVRRITGILPIVARVASRGSVAEPIYSLAPSYFHGAGDLIDDLDLVLIVGLALLLEHDLVLSDGQVQNCGGTLRLGLPVDEDLGVVRIGPNSEGSRPLSEPQHHLGVAGDLDHAERIAKAGSAAVDRVTSRRQLECARRGTSQSTVIDGDINSDGLGVDLDYYRARDP